MFSIHHHHFLIREFFKNDLQRLFLIADAINKQAHQKKDFQPFYAFNTPIEDENYSEKLLIKTKAFLEKAETEKNTSPRAVYRLALCKPNNLLIGNITLDMIPSKDANGKLIYGDLGYFIDPMHGRNGLMSQAIEEVLKKYFRFHEQMDITIHPENIHSLRLMQRFQAKIIGLKKNSIYQGEPRLVLCLTKEDFLKRRMPQRISKKTIMIPPFQHQRGQDV